ncbi:3-mercaptopyruvate sulfurtransferase isoform X1 [Hippocampus zosterae]|uniref:3-mercaptopyruvate sulfurtransferase isoform X1 n=1 Tax=Hippocampus zosterae TaxID=109293 RepID=UPI00223E6B29|nr:3-mercaptopyruvate sulfurtransferase isoform X1 [Hippocampus zosterae]
MAAQARAVVSAQWLSDAIRNGLVGSKIRVLDSSWYLPITKRDPKAEFAEKHIPGSSYFDIDECSDQSSPYDHMLPTSSHFSRYVGELGIGNDTHVVVYDTNGFGSYSAPRVWWMFRLFGHNSVSVLDGGMKNWLAEGRPVTSEQVKPERKDFKVTTNNTAWVKTYEDVLENISNKTIQVVDARSAGRYRGVEPEPREGTLPGHFPGAINMPFTSFLEASGKYLANEDLSRRFREAGVKLDQPLWATCGSGVTACLVVLAAHLLGHPGVCVYDGSWAEWFQRASPENVISEGEGKKM